MKRAVLGMTAALLLGAAAANADDAVREVPITPEAPSVADLERVDSMRMLRRPHSWHAIDNETLIVWVTPFDPYLVELAFPRHDLKWSHAIGLSQTGSRVYARFDTVYVGGFRYPISNIYKMTREDAKSWGKIAS